MKLVLFVILRLFEGFLSERKGSLATTSAIIFTVLLAAGGVAADYTLMRNIKHGLQQTADAAALAAVKEMSVANATEETIQAVVDNFISANTVSDFDPADLEVNTTISFAGTSVRVEISNAWSPFLLHHMGVDVTPLSAHAKAELAGSESGTICLLGLHRASGQAVSLMPRARLTAENCGVYSNSPFADGMVMHDLSDMDASTTCSSGGVVLWSPTAIDPPAVTDCPPMPDPLSGRKAPAYGKKCDHQRLRLVNKTRTLEPGVYCNGVQIMKGSNIRFLPGIYIFKAGMLSAADTSTIEGENVSFVFTEEASFRFAQNTTIRLTAPRTGEMAGILIFEDPNPGGKTHQITSNNARVLTGTIYIPKGTLQVDAQKMVADMSSYTSIIANKVRLKDGPHLHLNSDYSTIPLPEGMDAGSPGGGGGSGKIFLSR